MTAPCIQELDAQAAAAADSASSSSSSSSSSFTGAAEEPSANALQITGSRPHTYSNQYMLAVREFQLLTGVSNNKAAQAHALIVLETCAEYERLSACAITTTETTPLRR